MRQDDQQMPVRETGGRRCTGSSPLTLSPQPLYTVRSELLLVERLEYNLLFRWFVGLATREAIRTPTTFTKNRARLLAGDITRQFLKAAPDAGAGEAQSVG